MEFSSLFCGAGGKFKNPTGAVMALERKHSSRAVIRLSPEARRKDETATDETGGKSSEGEKDHVTLAQMRARTCGPAVHTHSYAKTEKRRNV